MGNRSTEGGARRLAAVASLAILAGTALTGCAHGGRGAAGSDAGLAEGLPLEVHAELREVLILDQGPGAAPITEGDPAASDAATEAAQGRLIAAVTAAAERAGAPGARHVGPGAWTDTAEPRRAPEAASWSDEVAVAPSAPPPPAPRRGVAWVVVRIGAVRGFRATGGGPRLLSADFVATVVAGRGRGRTATAGQAFTLTDASPIPAEREGAGAPEADAALERLVERAAARIVGGLLATADEPRHLWGGDGCGLAERGRQPGTDPNTARWHTGLAAAPPAPTAHWEAWEPDLPAGAAVAITYDLRVWRLDGPSGPEPLTSLDGLAQTTAGLAPAGTPVAWTVRGVAALPDGRRLPTPWSQARPAGAPCPMEPEPQLVHRIGDARSGAAAGGPKVTGVYAPQTWNRRREGLGLNPATGLLLGAGHGAGSGLMLSFACGPFFPVCAMFAVPGGAAVGAGAGLVVGGASTAIENSTAVERVPIAGGQLGAALGEAVTRAAHAPARHAEVAAAATAALGGLGEAGTVRLDALEARLIGEAGEGFPARLWLEVGVTLERPAAPPVVRKVPLGASDAAPAARWAADGGALIEDVLRAALGAAGPATATALLAAEPAPPPPPPPRRGPDDEPPSAVFTQ